MSGQTENFELKDSSAWDLEELEDFLARALVPLRLGIDTDDGPLIVPLWFRYQEGVFWCVTHRDAFLVEAVRARPVCAIDISTNTVPYRGVRGQVSVEVVPERGAALIEHMLERYFGGTDSGLARWLLDRRDEEVGLRIAPRWLTSWDFSERMDDLPRTGDEVDSS
jgi:nitroimidazol reductase NimA-like FMN-containing flavoprotein (pyridoxamine 5'-phosphate oxidase superfamily)